jgi:hypothetical protein
VTRDSCESGDAQPEEASRGQAANWAPEVAVGGCALAPTTVLRLPTRIFTEGAEKVLLQRTSVYLLLNSRRSRFFLVQQSVPCGGYCRMSLSWLQARCLHTAKSGPDSTRGGEKSTRILGRKAPGFLLLHDSRASRPPLPF